MADTCRESLRTIRARVVIIEHVLSPKIIELPKIQVRITVGARIRVRIRIGVRVRANPISNPNPNPNRNPNLYL